MILPRPHPVHHAKCSSENMPDELANRARRTSMIGAFTSLYLRDRC